MYPYIMPPTCSFCGELELCAELVVAVGVLGGDPRQVDRRRPQRRDREVARVEVPLAVDGVQLPLRPQRVPRRRPAPRPPVVRQGSPLHPELHKMPNIYDGKGWEIPFFSCCAMLLLT